MPVAASASHSVLTDTHAYSIDVPSGRVIVGQDPFQTILTFGQFFELDTRGTVSSPEDLQRAKLTQIANDFGALLLPLVFTDFVMQPTKTANDYVLGLLPVPGETEGYSRAQSQLPSALRPFYRGSRSRPMHRAYVFSQQVWLMDANRYDAWYNTLNARQQAALDDCVPRSLNLGVGTYTLHRANTIPTAHIPTLLRVTPRAA